MIFRQGNRAFYERVSSLKRRQCRMKRSEDGAAVKIAQRSKLTSDFGNRKSSGDRLRWMSRRGRRPRRSAVYVNVNYNYYE